MSVKKIRWDIVIKIAYKTGRTPRKEDCKKIKITRHTTRVDLHRLIDKLISHWKEQSHWRAIEIEAMEHGSKSRGKVIRMMRMWSKDSEIFGELNTQISVHYYHAKNRHNIHGPAYSLYLFEQEGLRKIENWHVHDKEIPWLEALLKNLNDWPNYWKLTHGPMVITEMVKEGILHIEGEALENFCLMQDVMK